MDYLHVVITIFLSSFSAVESSWVADTEDLQPYFTFPNNPNPQTPPHQRYAPHMQLMETSQVFAFSKPKIMEAFVEF